MFPWFKTILAFFMGSTCILLYLDLFVIHLFYPCYSVLTLKQFPCIKFWLVLLRLIIFVIDIPRGGTALLGVLSKVSDHEFLQYSLKTIEKCWTVRMTWHRFNMGRNASVQTQQLPPTSFQSTTSQTLVGSLICEILFLSD